MDGSKFFRGSLLALFLSLSLSLTLSAPQHAVHSMQQPHGSRTRVQADSVHVVHVIPRGSSGHWDPRSAARQHPTLHPDQLHAHPPTHQPPYQPPRQPPHQPVRPQGDLATAEQTYTHAAAGNYISAKPPPPPPEIAYPPHPQQPQQQQQQPHQLPEPFLYHHLHYREPYKAEGAGTALHQPQLQEHTPHVGAVLQNTPHSTVAPFPGPRHVTSLPPERPTPYPTTPAPLLEFTTATFGSVASPSPPPPPPAPASPGPAVPNIGLHQELQAQLSQQIQLQLEQLQRLHELQQKMLTSPQHSHNLKRSASPPPSPSPGYNLPQQPPQGPTGPHRQQQDGGDPAPGGPSTLSTAAPPAPPTASPTAPSFPASLAPPTDQTHIGTGGAGTAARLPLSAVFPAHSDVPPPPPPPPFQEESRSLQSFIQREERQSPAPADGGFLPIPPPLDAPRSDPQGYQLDNGTVPDFLPFVEESTDPALPYYLLPPPADSDSYYGRFHDDASSSIADMTPPMSPGGREHFDEFNSLTSASAPEPSSVSAPSGIASSGPESGAGGVGISSASTAGKSFVRASPSPPPSQSRPLRSRGSSSSGNRGVGRERDTGQAKRRLRPSL